MTKLEIIKSRVNYLYTHSPRVRMNVKLMHPKIELQNDLVEIKGVYKNVFRIEEYSTGTPKCHTLQYTDILTGQFQIVE
ncbi:MAG: hypothetical protein IJ639_09655 [Ruminococcus sp.]|nr:hypothetical protein [Ruminococcus sp.]